MKKNLLFFLLILFSVGMYAEEEYLYLPFRSFDVSVSSYLTEGDIQYSEENLSPESKLPWVPDGSNNGKNAKIVIKNCFSKEIYISSGYVKTGREDLYYKNARPKIIEIYLKEKKYLRYVSWKILQYLKK